MDNRTFVRRQTGTLSERDKLSDELSGVKKLPSLVSETEEVVSQSSETDDRVQSSDEHSVDSEHSAESRRPPRRGSRLVQPPGFREIRSRVGTFSGRKGEDDFSLWLTDFEEATADFTWSDNARVRWFSWFIEGPAKATWQRTLTSEEHGSWANLLRRFSKDNMAYIWIHGQLTKDAMNYNMKN